MCLEALQGYWVKESLMFLLLGVITFIMTMLVTKIPYLGFLIAPFIAIPLTFGFTRRMLYLARGEEQPIEGLFRFYQVDYILGVLIVAILVRVQVFLFGLLLVIPGIIASHRYTLHQYLKNDHPDLSAREILSLSSKMMQGYKMDYFILNLSFIGWGMLAGPTVIGLFPLNIYMQVTTAKFYDYIKEVNGYDVGNKEVDEPRDYGGPKDDEPKNDSGESSKKNRRAKINIV